MINVKNMWDAAKRAAKDTFSGGVHTTMRRIEEQVKELGASQTASLVSKGVSYGISKIPIVGTEFAFIYDNAVADPILNKVNTKTIDVLLTEARAKGKKRKIIQYLAQSIDLQAVFGAYNVIKGYYDKEMHGYKLPKSCDEAYKESFDYALAKVCITNLEAGIQQIEELCNALKSELEKMKPGILKRKLMIKSRLFEWGIRHPEKRCFGPQGYCFYEPGEIPVNPQIFYDTDFYDADL